LEGVLCPEELERDKRPVWVVLIAYGCGFGLRAGSCLLGEPRGKEKAEGRAGDVVMKAKIKIVGYVC
jgi:hypothetical protein